MLAGEIRIKNEITKAISSFLNSINNTSLSKLNNLFSKIVYDTDIDISNWTTEDYDQFLREIDLVNNCHDNTETDSVFTKKYIPNILISFIASLQEIQSNNDINNHIYDIIINYLYDKTNGDIKSIVNYIIPLNIQDLYNESSITIITLLISSLKTLMNEKDKGIKELLQNVLNKINEIDIKENDKVNNSEYLNFMLSLFSELFNDIELKKVMKLLWEVTNGNTEQIAEYISYLLYKQQDNQKDDDEGAESKHFGHATRIVIEEYIEPLQQKQRRQIIRNRNKINESTSSITTQTEEEAANADLNEIYTFIRQVLHYTCLDDNQHGYPKELALFFSSFEDFWEPDMILKFILSNEEDKKTIEDNYKEYYGPFLMDLADLMNWTNKQCETALLVLTEGWKRKSRISIAKMMGLSVNDIKHLYNDCKDLTYNDAEYLSECEDNENDVNNERAKENEVNSSGDSFKTKKPVVLSIRGSDFKRSFTKPLTEKDNVGAGNNIICRYYGTPRGCTSGIHCPFKHIQTRSSYITRRLNHSMYSNPKTSYSGKFSNNSRYHNNGIINNIVKRKTSFQNSNYKNTSTRNGMNISDKSRLSNRVSNDSLSKFIKKGGEHEPHEKIDTPYGKNDLMINNKLRKQASFINYSSSYRNQTSKEYKPIEAIDPAIPQHSHSNIICYFYNDPRGCSNGKNCKFLHINANTSDRNRNYETGRNNYGYDNSNNKKPYSSIGSYKSYNSGYPNYNGSEGLSRGQPLNRKISRHLLRNNDPKLNQEFNSFNRNINEDNQLKDTNITSKLNDEDKSVMGGKDVNPPSITIVNSSQNIDTSSLNTTTKDENKNEILNNESSVINQSNTSFTISNSKTYSLTPCIFFTKEGSCKYGERCKFLHIR